MAGGYHPLSDFYYWQRNVSGRSFLYVLSGIVTSMSILKNSTQDPEPDPGPSSSSCYPHLHHGGHKRPLEDGAEAGGRLKMSRYSPPSHEDIDDIDRKISMAGGIRYSNFKC